MYLQTFRVKNFRRLSDVRVDLESQTTIFVGANNSGKTSATHIFQLFLGAAKSRFQIYDFTADCWETFNNFGLADGDPNKDLPLIHLDLWFNVDDDNLHRVVDLLPGLDWDGEPVGVRLVYAPRDGARLVANYREALAAAKLPEGKESASYKPWPQNLTDYLSKRLDREYEIKYYLLDFKQCSADYNVNEGYEPFYLGTATSGAGAVVDSLIRVDFLNAQRHLSDVESHGRAEDLSRRLSRFYERNLKKLETDIDAMSAISDSESRLNEHFADVFKPTLDSIGELGYPGISNPGLAIRATFNAHSILSSSARVHYSLPTTSDQTEVATLPDQYNGLGFKNLIYMAVEILDFHQAWAASEEERPPVHLIMVEEPEAHLHAQLQQVFIRKIFDLLPDDDPAFKTQMVVTTHSSHILYESDFNPVRYFCRDKRPGVIHHSDVKNLSTFYKNEEVATREFLQQYLKLTHCDLFFADAAILVEGNVERLLLPLIIRKEAPELRACHLTILEVGGAFAHKFRNLVEFLEITTLVITDIDSVSPAKSSGVSDVGTLFESDDEDDDDDDANASACITSEPDAVTSNQTLRKWLPLKETIAELLTMDASSKTATGTGGADLVRVAYQTRCSVTWNGETQELAGRTLEEAFALENLSLTQDAAHKSLGLHVRGGSKLAISALHGKIFTKVKNLDKTRFALALIACQAASWQTPYYIIDGLQWLRQRMEIESEPPAPGPVPEVEA